ncbi:MAG TPA: TauD/TfdA family dioxygenase [Bordetella sp.]
MTGLTSPAAQALRVEPAAAPLGARIHGVDLSVPLDDDTLARIEAALHRYGVVVFPEQRLTDAQQKRFSLRFGESLDIHSLRKFARPEHPEVFVLSNILVDGEPIGAADAAQYWHTDLSYMQRPSRVSILYALEVPRDASGPVGDTEFVSTVQAYEDLPGSVKAQLQGKRAMHLAGKPKKSQTSHFTKPLPTDIEDKLTGGVTHPVVRTHPFTGKKCLYVNEGFTVRIEDMPGEQSDSLLATLFDHMIRPERIYTHKWTVGDVVMWDNCATVHQGVPNYGPKQRRLMHRTIVTGSVPF